MADSTTTPSTEVEDTQGAGGTTTKDQAGSAGQPGKAFEPITSQEEFDRRIKARIERVRSTPPADYEDLKAKAARLDELEAANKSDLEKANDALAKAKKRADDWKSRYEELQAEQERAKSVAEMAARYEVDLGTLSRMAGDVEENAKYLAGLEAARPKYPAITDDGGKQMPSLTRDQILAERDTQKRQRLIAENIDLFS